jgi:hypothetical protein
VPTSEARISHATVESVEAESVELTLADGTHVQAQTTAPEFVLRSGRTDQSLRVDDRVLVEFDESDAAIGIEREFDVARETIRAFEPDWVTFDARRAFLPPEYITYEPDAEGFAPCPRNALRVGLEVYVATAFDPEISADSVASMFTIVG